MFKRLVHNEQFSLHLLGGSLRNLMWTSPNHVPFLVSSLCGVNKPLPVT